MESKTKIPKLVGNIEWIIHDKKEAKIKNEGCWKGEKESLIIGGISSKNINEE